MNLDSTKQDNITKPQMESLQQAKQEYMLLGKYRLKRHLKLYSFNHNNDALSEVEMVFKDTPTLVYIDANNWFLSGEQEYKVTVDSRNTYLQALNISSARERVSKFKKGKIKDLCNLRSVDSFDNLPKIF